LISPLADAEQSSEKACEGEQARLQMQNSQVKRHVKESCCGFPLWCTYTAVVADFIHSQYASYNCTCTQAGVTLAGKTSLTQSCCKKHKDLTKTKVKKCLSTNESHSHISAKPSKSFTLCAQ